MSKISLLTPAYELDGNEQVVLVKEGVTRRGALSGLVAASVAPHVDAAQLAANTALAASNFYGVATYGSAAAAIAAGEAATAAGGLFSVDDGIGNLIYRVRTDPGSIEVARTITPETLGAPTGGTHVGMMGAGTLQERLDHVGPSILNHVLNPVENLALPTAANHDDLFLRFIEAGGGLIPWLGFKWKLTRRFVAGDWPEAGGTLAIEPNPDPSQETLTYLGPQPDVGLGQKWGILEPPSGWRIVSTKPIVPVIAKSGTANPNLWVVMFRGAYDFLVKDIEGWNCNGVRTTASTDVYDDVVINYDRDRSGENCSADFKIVRCGARYDAIFPALRDGAICCHYSRDGEIVGGKVVRGPHGFMFWGGDARTDGLGQGHLWSNQRKCIRLTVRGLASFDTQGTFCWGAMGQDIEFINCTGLKCGDVGFDFEGCLNCVARGCRSVDATYGCFSVFFHGDGILFEGCIAITNDYTRPLFRMYTNSQSNSENRKVTLKGGHWINNDTNGIATIDTLSGNCRTLEIEGLSLTNVRIDTANNNAHHTRILNNNLWFTFASPARFSAIRAGFAKSLAGSAGAVVGKTQIIGNAINSTVEQPANSSAYGTGGDYGTCGIDLIEDDFNSSANDDVRDNRIGKGFLTPILIRNWSANAGFTPRVNCEGNTLGIHTDGDYTPIFVTNDGVGINQPVVTYRDNKREGGEPIEAPLTNLVLGADWAQSGAKQIPAFRRIGNSLQITGFATGGSTADGTQLAVLPIAVRPTVEHVCNLAFADGGTTKPGMVRITTDGELFLYGVTNNSEISISAMIPL